jgi:hypothetical protein
MVTVYFETPNGSYAEIVAKFADEKLYDACYPTLAGIAKEKGYTLTESIDEQQTLILL